MYFLFIHVFKWFLLFKRNKNDDEKKNKKRRRRKSFNFGNVDKNWVIKHTVTRTSQRRYVIISIVTAFLSPIRDAKRNCMWFNFKMLLSLEYYAATLASHLQMTTQFVWWQLLFTIYNLQFVFKKQQQAKQLAHKFEFKCRAKKIEREQIE